MGHYQAALNVVVVKQYDMHRKKENVFYAL